MSGIGAELVEDFPSSPLTLGDRVVGKGAPDTVDAGQPDTSGLLISNLQAELLCAGGAVAATQDLEDGALFGGGSTRGAMIRTCG